jgi:hypothetical protein
LTITEITAGDPAFSVSPGFATIAASDSIEVTVTFTPEASALGLQETTLAFDGVAATVVTATAQVSWGDATDDGSVDVADIVYGVDVVLGRVLPPAPAASSLDMFPFPSGDGSIDVRDLTVLTQAVLRGQWPNAIALPGITRIAGKASEDVFFDLLEGELRLHIRAAVRGVQARLRVEEGTAFLGEASAYQEAGTLTLLWVRMDGGELPLGEHLLMRTESASLLDAIAVGPNYERLPISMPLPEDLAFGKPFPNPFSPARAGVLRISGDGVVRIIDVLGREVWRGFGDWDGRGRDGVVVASGFYSVVREKRRDIVIVMK